MVFQIGNKYGPLNAFQIGSNFIMILKLAVIMILEQAVNMFLKFARNMVLQIGNKDGTTNW